MKKKTILWSCFCTLSAMLLFWVSCSKSTTSVVDEFSYEAMIPKYQTWEKDMKKKRVLIAGTNSWTSSAAIPIPVVTEFLYSGYGPSPLGAGYTRWRYRINFDAVTKAFICNKTIKPSTLEFRVTDAGSSGYNGPRAFIATGQSNCADWPRCFFVDMPNSVLSIPNAVTVAIFPWPQPQANYYQDGYAGYVLGSQLAPTKAVSKTYSFDPLPPPYSNSNLPCN